MKNTKKTHDTPNLFLQAIALLLAGVAIILISAVIVGTLINI